MPEQFIWETNWFCRLYLLMSYHIYSIQTKLKLLFSEPWAGRRNWKQKPIVYRTATARNNGPLFVVVTISCHRNSAEKPPDRRKYLLVRCVQKKWELINVYEDVLYRIQTKFFSFFFPSPSFKWNSFTWYVLNINRWLLLQVPSPRRWQIPLWGVERRRTVSRVWPWYKFYRLLSLSGSRQLQQSLPRRR